MREERIDRIDKQDPCYAHFRSASTKTRPVEGSDTLHTDVPMSSEETSDTSGQPGVGLVNNAAITDVNVGASDIEDISMISQCLSSHRNFQRSGNVPFTNEEFALDGTAYFSIASTGSNDHSQSTGRVPLQTLQHHDYESNNQPLDEPFDLARANEQHPGTFDILDYMRFPFTDYFNSVVDHLESAEDT